MCPAEGWKSPNSLELDNGTYIYDVVQ
jgi:hypothetical protein